MLKLNKMKKLLLLSIVLTFAYSCQSDDSKSTESTVDPALSATDLEILDNLPEANSFTSDDVVLPNGETMQDYLNQVDPTFSEAWLGRMSSDPYANLGPQDARNLLIARISAVALNLTDRSKHQIPDEGVQKPGQNGFAYSWGSKNHEIRQTPPGGGTVCSEQIYGLDCSGFIHQLFTKAGVSLVSGPADKQRKAKTLQDAIKSSIQALNKVKVEELGSIPTSKFQTGDIISWKDSNGKAFHIGMVLQDTGGNLAVFQSNGSTGTDEADCAKNRGTTRGPRRLQLTDPYWFGPNKTYGITRINAEISGNWSLFLRCSGTTTDAITLQLNFPTSNTNSFNISGTGIDYDGTAFDCTGVLQYDNTTNTLSGTLHMTKPSDPSFFRDDSFVVKLDRDETNYFPLVLGANFNAGCAVEGRLKNNE